MFLDERFTHNVSTKTWNDLKPPKNHLKPPTTTYNHLKPPTTTYNHLKKFQKPPTTTLKNIYSLSQTI